MQSVEIICVGKTGRGFYTEGCAEYIKRLAPFFKLTVTELAETRLVEDTPSQRERVIADESESLISARVLSSLERPSEPPIIKISGRELLAASAVSCASASEV